MKKINTILSIVLSFTLILGCFTGCGEEEQPGSLPGFTVDGSSEATGNSGSSAAENSGPTASGSGLDADTAVDEQQAIKDAFYADNGQGSTPVWAGVQVYNGDVVNIWRKMNGSEDLQKAQDIYLYDSDDNGKVIAKGVPSTCVGSWFYTYEGYSLNVMGSKLLCFTAEGTEKFNISAEGGVSGIVQLSDGTIVLLIKGADNSHTLAILDLEKAEYAKVPNLDLGKDRRLFISADDTGVVILNQTGFHDVNLETGELTERMPLSEYDYAPDYTLKTFQMQGGGAVKLLYQESAEMLMPLEIEKYRTVVTIQSDDFADYQLQLMLDEFNATNPKYYAVIESFADFDSPFSTVEEVFDALEKGQGADVIYASDAQWDEHVYKAMQLGYFEDLSPYMEKSGVYEEDYFPTAFDKFKLEGSIYGASFAVSSSGYAYKEEVLGGRDIRDLEDLVDALLAYTGPAIFSVPADSALWNLIRASDSVAGTVDWENKTCNFQGDLFAKLLEVCLLYGNDDYENNEKYEIMDSYIYTSGFYGYLNEEQRELAGDVYLGYFFDEGVYPSAGVYDSVHLNSNSPEKEGAWAVIAWLLSEEAQSQESFPINRTNRFTPSNVFAFEAVVQAEMEETALMEVPYQGHKMKYYKHITNKNIDTYRKMSDEEYRSLYNLKEQDAEEIREQLYTAKALPTRTEPIQDIIFEEVDSYFNGERSLGDTCDAIQVRVQGYLDGLE